MHEYSYALRIIKAAEQYAKNVGAVRVTNIRVTVSPDAGLAAESVALYFDLIGKGSLCEGAALEIHTAAPLLRCRTCGRLFKRRPFSFMCDGEGCGGEGEPLGVENEWILDSIVIDTPE